ncbi:MAG: phosphotransferase [Rhodobacteraceae bacterium]|nr:phosphotransferase [Paracoccaceae bacterium]
MTGEARARAMADAALHYWGRAEGTPRLVKWRENIVFEAHLRSGAHVALRLHRPGYQSRRAIEAELDWTGRLHAAGLAVPAPVPALNGRPTVRVGDRVASVVAWIDGEPLGAAERPLAGDEAGQAAMMAGVGALVARLHEATDRLALPAGFPRPRWDGEGLLGDRPRWGRFWTNPALSPAEREDLLAARAAARAALDGMAREGADFGLIHADILRENILQTGAGLALIDFDDSGWGFRLYDLATAIVQSLEEPALPALAAAVVAGYRGVRPLPERDAARLSLFVALRAFASCGWIATRAPAEDPRQRFYADRAVRAAASVLSGRAIWD